MKIFNPIHREFVAPADLGTLERTYNTLETGHKEAVRAASQLEIEMANLDLNEAEAGWRQQKIDDIRTTIQQNTIAGNSYAALDDIVAKAGNIASDAGMIGRLNAQRDMKAYMDKLNARTDIPEEYKEYYREKNPYFYEDQVREDGRIVGGTKWEPVEREVSTVPLSELIVKGINIAAKEAGGGAQTRWIDSSGNVTTDPTKVFDGEVYNSSTNQWQRLTKEKIMQGITSMIESTPGAKASLEQDYKIAKWKYSKNGNVNPDVTDKNGMVLGFNDYILKQIDPAAQAASFYNSTNYTTYGAGLKTYKAAQKAAAAAAAAANNPYQNRADSYTTDSTPITVEYDYAGNLQAQKQNSTNVLNNIYKELTGKDMAVAVDVPTSTDWQQTIQAAADEAKAKGVSPQRIAELMATANRNIRNLTEAANNYNQIKEAIPKEDQPALDFISRLNSGGDLDPSNPYDQRILKSTNNLFTDNTEKVRARFTNPDAYKTALAILGGGDKAGYQVLGYTTGHDSEGNPYIELSKEHYNQAYLFSTAISGAYNTAGITRKLWQGVKSKFGGDRDIEVERLDADGNPIVIHTRGGDVGGLRERRPIDDMNNIISDYNSANNKVQTAISNKVPAAITLDNKSLRFATFTDAETFDAYQAGAIDRADYNVISDLQREELRTKIVNHDFAMTDMFMVSDKKGAGMLQRTVDSKDRREQGRLIQIAAANNQAVYSAAHNPVYGTGTNVTIYSKYDADGNPKGEPVTYFIPSLVLEGAADRFEDSAITRANNKIAIGDQVRQTFQFTDVTTSPTLGIQSIQCLGNNNFVYTNDDQQFPVNRTSAVAIAKALEEFNDLRDAYKAGYIYSGVQNQAQLTQINENLEAKLNEFAIVLSDAIDGGRSKNLLVQQLLSDLTK